MIVSAASIRISEQTVATTFDMLCFRHKITVAHALVELIYSKSNTLQKVNMNAPARETGNCKSSCLAKLLQSTRQE